MSDHSHLKGSDVPPASAHFDITTILCNFAWLIEKDGGIRPCDVLATCAYKVLRSTYPHKMDKKDKRESTLYPSFRYKLGLGLH